MVVSDTSDDVKTISVKAKGYQSDIYTMLTEDCIGHCNDAILRYPGDFVTLKKISAFEHRLKNLLRHFKAYTADIITTSKLFRTTT